MEHETLTLTLEWFGAISSALGALLLAMNNEYSRYGWVVFFFANLSMITFALIMGLHGILFMQIVFMGTTLLGLYHWFSGREREVIPR